MKLLMSIMEVLVLCIFVSCIALTSFPSQMSSSCGGDFNPFAEVLLKANSAHEPGISRSVHESTSVQRALRPSLHSLL